MKGGGIREGIYLGEGFEENIPPSCPASCLCGIISECSPSY